MTIKSHFNRSTTTKTVSRAPVSFEISIWKSRLKETRLHYFVFFFLGGWLFHFVKKKKKKKKHTYYITFHKTYSINGDMSPTSLADVPRATSPVLGPPESSRSRALLVAHTRLAIRQTTMLHRMGHRGESASFTWDIAANRHHYEQSKLCHVQWSQNDWLNVIRSCVSIQQNCQEARQELYPKLLRSWQVELWQAVKSKPQMWATKRCDLVDTSSSISI